MGLRWGIEDGKKGLFIVRRFAPCCMSCAKRLNDYAVVNSRGSRWGWIETEKQTDKSFLLLFFKKEDFLFLDWIDA